MIKQVYKSIPKSIKYHLEPLAARFRRIRNKYLSKIVKLEEFPPIIQIETNSFCNGSCIFCPYPNVRNNQEIKFMRLEIFKKAMDECSNYPVESIYLCLMNEPLTDKRIVDLIDYAKSKNPDAKIGLTTNAQLLSDPLGRLLLNSKLDVLSFSVHGWTEDTYAKVMGLDFNRVLENMTNFLGAARGRNLKINMVCVKTKYFTKKDYYFGYSFCKKHNIDFGLGEMFNMAENLDVFSENEIAIKKMRRKKLWGCMDNWPLVSIHILYSGEVVACCMDWRREVILGNICDMSLYGIWNAKPYQDFRDKVYRGKPSQGDFICKRCSASV